MFSVNLVMFSVNMAGFSVNLIALSVTLAGFFSVNLAKFQAFSSHFRCSSFLATEALR